MKKGMYSRPNFTKTSIELNKATEGEPIETMIERMTENGSQITNTVEKIYTDRKDGVIKAYDIRADKHDIALDAMDIATKSEYARRDGYARKSDDVADATIGKPESTDGEVTN